MLGSTRVPPVPCPIPLQQGLRVYRHHSNNQARHRGRYLNVLQATWPQDTTTKSRGVQPWVWYGGNPRRHAPKGGDRQTSKTVSIECSCTAVASVRRTRPQNAHIIIYSGTNLTMQFTGRDPLQKKKAKPISRSPLQHVILFVENKVLAGTKTTNFDGNLTKLF